MTDIEKLLEKCDAALKAGPLGTAILLFDAYPHFRDEIKALTDENKAFRVELTKCQDALRELQKRVEESHE